MQKKKKLFYSVESAQITMLVLNEQENFPTNSHSNKQ